MKHVYGPVWLGLSPSMVSVCFSIILWMCSGWSQADESSWAPDPLADKLPKLSLPWMFAKSAPVLDQTTPSLSLVGAESALALDQPTANSVVAAAVLDQPTANSVVAAAPSAFLTASAKEDEEFLQLVEQNNPPATVDDPLEGWNRIMFSFNDWVYTVILRPLAIGYSAVVPEGGRLAVENVFQNAATPVYCVNALLQGKGQQAGVELGRFGINTLLGVAGIFDVAEESFHLKSSHEDFGQTLGTFGFGDELYLVWPLIGPANLRDTIGRAGDTLLKPLTYLPEDSGARWAIRGAGDFNDYSLRREEYEKLKDSSLDAYLAIRDAYLKMRQEKIAQ